MRLTNFSILIFLALFASCRGKAIVFDESKPIHLTEDLIIDEKDTLYMKPGAEVTLDTGVSIITYGEVFIKGSKENPVVIKASNQEFGWKEIRAKGECNQLHIENAIIENGLIFSYLTDIHFKNVTFRNSRQLEWNDAIARFWSGQILIENCRIESNHRGEGFLVHNIDRPVVRNCVFTKIPDAVEYLHCTNGVIEGNEFLFMKDDAIDQNACIGTLIKDNRIFYVKGRGMELGSEKFGSSDSLRIINNVIIGCTTGIILKESSSAYMSGNTFYDNDVAVESNTPVDSTRASRIEVHRSVFKDNKADFLIVGNSELTFTECLSDSILLEGKGNVLGECDFENLEKHNYNLVTEHYPEGLKKGALGYGQ